MATCDVEKTYPKEDEDYWDGDADDLWETFMNDCYENPDEEADDEIHFEAINSEQFKHEKMAERGCEWISLPHPSKTLDMWVNGLKWVYECLKMHLETGDDISFEQFYNLMKYGQTKKALAFYVKKIKEGVAVDALYEPKTKGKTDGPYWPKGPFTNSFRRKKTVADIEKWLISKEATLQKPNQPKDRNSGSQSGSNPSSRSNTPNTSQIHQTPPPPAPQLQPPPTVQPVTVPPVHHATAPANTPQANAHINQLEEILRVSQTSHSPQMTPQFPNNSHQQMQSSQNNPHLHLGPTQQTQQRRPHMKTTHPTQNPAQHNKPLQQNQPPMNNSHRQPNVNMFANSNSNNQQNFQQQNADFMRSTQGLLSQYAPYRGQPSSSQNSNMSHQQPPSYQNHQNRNFQQQGMNQRPPPNAQLGGQSQGMFMHPDNISSHNQEQQRLLQQQQQRHQQQRRQVTGPQAQPPQPNRPVPPNGQVKRMIPPEYEMELSRNRRVTRELIEVPKTSPVGFSDAKSLLESPHVTSSNSHIKNGDIFIATIKGKRCYFKKKIFLVLITNPQWRKWLITNPTLPIPANLPQWIPLPPSGESIQCELIGTVNPNMA